jgi:hypothetical protein
MSEINPKITYRLEVTSKEMSLILRALAVFQKSSDVNVGSAKLLRAELVRKKAKCQAEIVKAFNVSIEFANSEEESD